MNTTEYFSTRHKKRHHFWPHSLVGRMVCMLVFALILAEIISGLFWYQQYSSRNESNLENMSRGLTQNMLSTYKYMSSFPRNYRYLILRQQFELGGGQFFISINNHEIEQNRIKENDTTKQIIDYAFDEATNLVGIQPNISITLTEANQLRILNPQILMKELPREWTRLGFSITNETQNVLVIQLPLNDKEWFFIAAPLPPPYNNTEFSFFNSRQLKFMVCSILLVIFFAYLLIRRELKPLSDLAKGANSLNSKLEGDAIEEKGSNELRSAIRAFNYMQHRLRSYLHNREMLFTAISHDLKTPLTRLRLRAEMMNDDKQREKFEQDIADLELMVKGALQSMKDTDIHENIEHIDAMYLLNSIAETNPLITIKGKSTGILGRPLAIKRCLDNIISNGLKYGHKVDVLVEDYEKHVMFYIRDYGPGIPEDQQENVFKPYHRLQKDNNGTGLGLAIARSIARSHGGEIMLDNHPDGGLIVILRLQRYN